MIPSTLALIVSLALLSCLVSGHMDGMFMPMVCNNKIDSAPCLPFSSQNYTTNKTIKIPCGSCVLMDATGDLELQGLDVQGKLVFPSSRQSLKIVTPFIFVQGEMVIEELAQKVIPQPDHDLEFHFVGTTPVTFTSHHNQSYSKCASGCDISKKPLVVAGGSLNIQGMHAECPTWSRLFAVQDAGAPIMNTTIAPSLKPDYSETLVYETFDDINSLSIIWDGRGAPSNVNEGYFTVSQRTSGTEGPRVYLPYECIIPYQPYVLKLKYRYRHSSSAKTSFGAPYIKLIRSKVGGGSDWISVDEVWGRGAIADVSIDEWHDLQTTVQFSDIMADPNSTSALSLYVAPFSESDFVDIDDFELTLAPAFEGRSCDSLLSNGQANQSGGHIYPFYPTGGYLTIVQDDNSTFFRSSQRTSTWQSILSQNIASECLAKASVYSFFARVRVNSIEAREVSFMLDTGKEYSIAKCPPSSNEWVTCSGNFRITEEIQSAITPRLYTRVLSDDTSPVNIANISFTHNGGRITHLTLENSTGISECWGPDAEILITSHTIQHEDSQVAKIDSVSNGIITLKDPIYRPLTIEDDPMTAVEVALLTRNIRFTAAEDDIASPLDGGHFIIMHTSAPVIQKIIGIENQGFGQQGKLGRYPLHFHMCDSVAGSLVSKNSIRNTKQRGIVVHGTNDLYLSDNIIHNTRGHSVMLEDGGETGNTFAHNLGAVTNGVTIRISTDESDPTPATFWITNPQNVWIGNVAAGSSFSGFWFEVTSRVRGPSKMKYPDMIPNKLDLSNFIDNVSHSNSQGLQTYPQTGYRPDNLAVFKNHKSFRNRISGVFFHAGGRLSIDGGYLSDNKIGVDIDLDHSDVISNTVIIGSSPAYQNLVDSMGADAYTWPEAALCGYRGTTLVGVRLDSYHSGDLFGATGSKLSNITFSGFGPSSCPGSTSIHVDNVDIQYFDTRNRLAQVVTLDDSQKIDLCGGEMQVAIQNVDGSFMGQAGYVISDTSAIRAHPDCLPLSSSCAAFCPGVCLRTITVAVPSYYERLVLTLEVTGTLPDGREITPIHVQDFETKYILEPYKESSHGRLFVTLPSGGNYTGRFFMDNETMWPLYTDLRYEDAVDNCGPDFASFEIEQGTPAQCDQLVQNGDFEDNIDYWWHVGALGLNHADGGASGSLKSLSALNTATDGGQWIGVGQYIDTRCIEQGYRFNFNAKVKLTDSETGELFVCNVACPTATLRFVNRLTDVKSWPNIGKMLESGLEWNTMEGSLVATSENAAAYSVFLYINGAPAGVNIQVDEVSLTRSVETPSPTLAPATPSTVYPTIPPTQAPFNPSSMPQSTSPVTSSELSTIFEASNEESIIFNTDSSIHLVTQSGLDSTVLSKNAHVGELDLVVNFNDRFVSDEGYQPHLVLFFAPDVTKVEDVTTNDNGFETYFEPSVVAWMQEKVHCCIDSTWFLFKGRGENGDYIQHGTSPNIKMESSGSLRLKRSSGVVSSYFSFDNGMDWSKIGSDVTLPIKYQTAPLKVGFRIKRVWKSAYDLIVRPTIVSEGEVESGAIAGPSSSFTNANTEQQSASCGQDGCALTGPDYNAILLSQETFSGDISFTAKVNSRDIFGTGYQSGLWLFFALPDATLASIPSNDNDFKSCAVATVGDKIHATIDHTWTYMTSKIDTGRFDQTGGDGWKNTDGYLKLTRINGVIKASMSSNGNGWKDIGVPKALPAAIANSPLKLGLRTQRNWASGYNILVIPTVEEIS